MTYFFRILIIITCVNLYHVNLVKAFDEMKMIEVESRYVVINPAQLGAYVCLELEYVKSQKQRDVYFDTSDGMLFKQGVFIRLRNGNTVDFKFNMKDFLSKSVSGSHTSCHEFSFSFPLNEAQYAHFLSLIKVLGLPEGNKKTFASFLEQNNFYESIIVEKERKEYKKGKITVCIDEVANLGTFLELEILVSQEEEVEEARKKLDCFLPTSLSLKRLTTGYIALFWREKDFNIYRAGKYHTAEDKITFLQEQE